MKIKKALIWVTEQALKPLQMIADLIQKIEDAIEANRPLDETAKPIEEVIEEIMADVPDEEFEKLPKDGASQHDYYLYGTPKKGDKECLENTEKQGGRNRLK